MRRISARGEEVNNYVTKRGLSVIPLENVTQNNVEEEFSEVVVAKRCLRVYLRDEDRRLARGKVWDVVGWRLSF